MLDEEYLPTIDLHSGRALTFEDEPDALRLTDHHEVDLEPSIRDAISLAEPIAPLDRPDCPGLCPVCGLPLDEGEPRSPRRRHRPAAGGVEGVPARRLIAGS